MEQKTVEKEIEDAGYEEKKMNRDKKGRVVSVYEITEPMDIKVVFDKSTGKNSVFKKIGKLAFHYSTGKVVLYRDSELAGKFFCDAIESIKFGNNMRIIRRKKD